MKPIDRRAAEFRRLQELSQLRLRRLNLSELGELSRSLSIQEFRALEFLGGVQPQMMRQLAEFLGLALNSVVDVVDGLEEQGYAQRRRDDADRRVVRVELTKKGRLASDAISKGMQNIYRTYLSALTNDEQETLLSLYRKISGPPPGS